MDNQLLKIYPKNVVFSHGIWIHSVFRVKYSDLEIHFSGAACFDLHARLYGYIPRIHRGHVRDTHTAFSSLIVAEGILQAYYKQV